jgi:hypothetical protein
LKFAPPGLKRLLECLVTRIRHRCPVVFPPDPTS